MEQTFEFGDYVAYEPGYGEAQIGRVTEDAGNEFLLVCFHDGCTAAYAPREKLRHATDEEIEAASPDIGFHRFDESCPDYDRDACFMCEHAGYEG